ncbi:hypothetical protein M1M96_02145, partial [Peptococcaceae bacterium]|nr:hypothetical protein [Peptococcaceae bacterium]
MNGVGTNQPSWRMKKMGSDITPARQSAGGSDLTFITNEKNRRLLDRFKALIKDTRFFDVLVGYFYTSGFYALYKSLESTEKIRILIGISTNKEVTELIQKSKNQLTFQFSHAEAK